ncbi:MAG: hypothetical protein K6E86_03510 [Bacteroidales bacterium]|nr:hypothetical protein [Bacteroidales bacterium]
MKKNYSTPAITIVEIELQSIIALSDINSTTINSTISKEDEGVSNVEAGAASYRSNLWD